MLPGLKKVAKFEWSKKCKNHNINDASLYVTKYILSLPTNSSFSDFLIQIAEVLWEKLFFVIKCTKEWPDQHCSWLVLSILYGCTKFVGAYPYTRAADKFCKLKEKDILYNKIPFLKLNWFKSFMKHSFKQLITVVFKGY